MTKKNYRADNTYLIEGNSGDNPKLMGRALSDGRDSLYLEFYFGKVEVTSRSGTTYQKNERRNEILGLYLWQAPRTPLERKQNKETLEMAKRIRFERGQELLERTEGYRLKKDKDVDFLKWMWAYYEAYTKADKRHIKRAYNCFVDYLIDPDDRFTPKPNWTKEQREKAAKEKAKRTHGLKIKAQQLTKEMITGFTEYLQRRFKGEGAHTLYARFKKIIKAAVEDDVIRKNPCNGIVIKIDGNTLKKDVLSIEEIQQLITTHYEGESTDIRRAFIFCLYCGLRWCDVKDLTFANVDYSNKRLTFEQAKTKGHSNASGVVIPLNDGLLNLIGKGERDTLIFPLPSHTMCLKALRHWTKRAGIDKHITWHCARHSFAVNILNNGANIKTVANLLGHSGLKHTEKYTRAVDSLKEAAINSLPELEL
ncbi:site-specific integrase [uncultured Duncaniella sp.]|uniref:site-specific integrase n=1 Tax=uncultured Duncaniella sp. TaxID=2768039 RepID=UPI0025AFC4A7|nr:site-specific integrase [uncultured Duncaniella sp.]